MHAVWLLFVEDADSDDDDFIEVAAKEGLELSIPEHRREEYGLAAASTVTSASVSWQQKERQHDIEDPTSIVASVMKRRQLEQDTAVAMLDDYYLHC